MRTGKNRVTTVAYNQSGPGLAALTFSNEGYAWPDDETPMQADAERGEDTPYWRLVVERQRAAADPLLAAPATLPPPARVPGLD